MIRIHKLLHTGTFLACLSLHGQQTPQLPTIDPKEEALCKTLDHWIPPRGLALIAEKAREKVALKTGIVIPTPIEMKIAQKKRCIALEKAGLISAQPVIK